MNKEIFNLKVLKNIVDNACHNFTLNNVKLEDVKIQIKNNTTNDSFNLFTISQSISNIEPSVSFNFFQSDIINVKPKDKRPNYKGAEYVRYINLNDDLSGEYKNLLHVDVVSIEAAERIIRFIKYILESDNIKTCYDWNNYYPEKVRLSIYAEEFDTETMYKLIKNNISENRYDLITEDIIKQTVKINK